MRNKRYLLCCRLCSQRSYQMQREDEISDYIDKVYQGYNREISTLWQRSVFLGAFLLAGYTAYGKVLSTAVEYNNVTFAVFNQLNIELSFVSLICVILSVLWIFMAKGSKAHQESFEMTLRTICSQLKPYSHIFDDGTDPYGNYKDIENKKGFVPDLVFLKNSKNFNKFGKGDNEKGFWHENIDTRLLSTEAGVFSPAKVNIALGIVSFAVSFCLFVFHIFCLLLFNPQSCFYGLCCCSLLPSRYFDYVQLVVGKNFCCSTLAFVFVTALIASYWLLKKKTESGWLNR